MKTFFIIAVFIIASGDYSNAFASCQSHRFNTQGYFDCMEAIRRIEDLEKLVKKSRTIK